MIRPPAINIATIQNCGYERYACIDEIKFFAYIDVKHDDRGYIATVQIGRILQFLTSSQYIAKTKKKAVLLAFDRIIDWIKGNDELLRKVCCPDILRPYKMRMDAESMVTIKEEIVQMSLF